MRPDFLIIGAEKAGTTWLHDVLRAHPDLFLPDTKELHFFNRFDSNGREIDTYARRGLGWYERHFEAAERGKPAGEATPLYLCDPAAPRRIRRTLPEARFIVLLRDPVSRTWSHYRMARAKGHITEDLATLIDRRDARIVGRGLYAAQLDRWFALFPRERFLILFFEQVMAEPQAALTRIAAWLEVDPAPLLEAGPEVRRNAATGYRSAAVYNASVVGARALRHFPPTRSLARRMKAAGLYDLLKRANRVEAPMLSMTQAERMALVACFRDDVARLSTAHGLDPPWSGRFALAASQSPEPEPVLHVP
ncbi:MAG: Sulfotransferase domain [Rhodobacteraceae bacterium HLUCCO18]|nr:MAG: Sulfotransferase domain [Rhodobacteraceae bacterium HLUCCO18]